MADDFLGRWGGGDQPLDESNVSGEINLSRTFGGVLCCGKVLGSWSTRHRLIKSLVKLQRPVRLLLDNLTPSPVHLPVFPIPSVLFCGSPQSGLFRNRGYNAVVVVRPNTSQRSRDVFLSTVWTPSHRPVLAVRSLHAPSVTPPWKSPTQNEIFIQMFLEIFRKFTVRTASGRRSVRDVFILQFTNKLKDEFQSPAFDRWSNFMAFLESTTRMRD
jgi:hypothetical protein